MQERTRNGKRVNSQQQQEARDCHCFKQGDTDEAVEEKP
jgi:hypothetical protein